MEQISTKTLDFTGQNIYVGIDVHNKSWKVDIYNDDFELKSLNQEPSVDRLCKYLESNYKNANYLLAYEAGFSGFWIQRAFAKNGVTCKVIHPADVPTNHKEHLRKTDAVDSRKIAKGLKNHELNFIHVPELNEEFDRLLVRSRVGLAKDMTRVKNRIKALLKLQGIIIPDKYSEGNWNRAFINWLKQIEFGYPSGKLALDNLLSEYDFFKKRKLETDAAIRKLSQTDYYKNNLELLLSIPSIGRLTGMILLTELGNIKRFKRLDDLCSYCGIVPNCHSSGETERDGGLTRRGNAIVKRVLIECAWVAIKKDPALLLYYKEQTSHMKGQKAIIKVARKLVSRIRYVLLNQQKYELGIVK
jgi:transposase